MRMCWKRTGIENSEALSFILSLCTPSFTRVTRQPSVSTSPKLIDPAKGLQSDRIRLALLTYGAADGCGHTFLVVWQGSLLFFMDSLSNGLHRAAQRAFMIVCRSPEDVKRYLDYRFGVRKGFQCLSQREKRRKSSRHWPPRPPPRHRRQQKETMQIL
jgi:hypothetical protein